MNPDDYRIRFYDPYGEELPDVYAWSRAMEQVDKRVARTRFANGVELSTIWLGLDHNYVPRGRPLIYESMVFGEGSLLDLDIQRYSTLAQAWAGHWQFAAIVSVVHGEPIDTDLGPLGREADAAQ